MRLLPGWEVCAAGRAATPRSRRPSRPAAELWSFSPSLPACFALPDRVNRCGDPPQLLLPLCLTAEAQGRDGENDQAQQRPPRTVVILQRRVGAVCLYGDFTKGEEPGILSMWESRGGLLVWL